MTAGTRPSRRTERAAPLPVPLRVTAASCFIAAMMMSFICQSRPASRGVGTGAKRRLIEKRGDRSKSANALLLSAHPRKGFSPEKRHHDGRIGEQQKLADRERRARRG